MRTAGRMLMMAEMHGRDLLRRHLALLLLLALPLAFYLSSNRTGRTAVTAGGVGMAFAIAGATLFSTLSSAEVDQRLVLGGYRPIDLVVGRFLCLGPLALVVAGCFWGLMTFFAHAAEPWLVLLGLCVVALQSVPLGLAVGAGVGRELEGTLVVIGVVGIQMAASSTSTIAKVLPFREPQQVIITGFDGHGALLEPLLLTVLYGALLLTLARIFLIPRLDVAAHRAQAEHAMPPQTPEGR